MIGCDIIDLEYTKLHSNYQRRGFLQKIFTDQEQSLIHQSSDPFHLVWRLWSMKESAYKVHAHISQARTFNPSKLVCRVIDDTRGSVEIDSRAYPTLSEHTEHYIFTLASSFAIDNLQSKIIELDDLNTSSQSKACYDALLQQVCLDKEWDRSKVEIRKTKVGIPIVLIDGEEMDIEVSISHHGRFGGYVILWYLVLFVSFAN